MAGKYAAVTGSLPRLVANETSYQDHVNQRKTELRASEGFRENPVGLATLYALFRESEDDVELQAKDLRLSLEAVSQMLEEQYEAEGTTSVKLLGGASVSLQVEPYAQVKDKDAHREWALAQGLGRLMTLPWGTTNALTKERLLAGEPPPDGVEAFAKTKFVLRKG